MQAAAAIAMLAEVQLVTQPASAPVASAMVRLASRWSSAMSTACGRIAAMAATTSGLTGLAPKHGLGSRSVDQAGEAEFVDHVAQRPLALPDPLLPQMHQFNQSSPLNPIPDNRHLLAFDEFK